MTPFEAHCAFQQSLFFPVLRMMQRGLRIDNEKRRAFRRQLLEAGMERQARLEFMVGHAMNVNSRVQMQNLFYKDLGIPGIRHMKTDRFTLDSNALDLIAVREPILLPLCQTVAELRSIRVFTSNFIEAEPDPDGRMRTSFAIAGPTTYRFASRENAFYRGMNFQNLPKKEKKKIRGAKNYVKLPNIRELFIPDDGYVYFDMDLDRADLQVVVWEADDPDLKKVLREGLDMHCVSACDIFDIKGIPYDELKESHPNYEDRRKQVGEDRRNKAKAGVHAVDYFCQARKLAMTLGITVHEAQRFIDKWLGAHPGIREWHTRTQETVAKRGYIENRFGARLYCMGDFDLPEFLAWQPQSTVSGVINRALVAIDTAQQSGACNIELQIQVHDSLAGQFPIADAETAKPMLRSLASIPIPYPDPLIIPVGIKTSTQSWGACQ